MDKKQKEYDGAHAAIDMATKWLKECEEAKCPPEIAYAAFGNAFTRLHRGLGKGVEEWKEISTVIGELLELPPD